MFLLRIQLLTSLRHEASRGRSTYITCGVESTPRLQSVCHPRVCALVSPTQPPQLQLTYIMSNQPISKYNKVWLNTRVDVLCVMSVTDSPRDTRGRQHQRRRLRTRWPWSRCRWHSEASQTLSLQPLRWRLVVNERMFEDKHQINTKHQIHVVMIINSLSLSLSLSLSVKAGDVCQYVVIAHNVYSLDNNCLTS